MLARYWLFLLLTLALTGLIGYGTYSTAKLLQTWKPDRNLLLFPTENVLRLLLVPICIGLGIGSGLDLVQLGWVFPAPLLQVVQGVLWGALLATIFYLSTRWLVARTGERFYSSTVIELIVPHNRRELLWVALAMVSVVLVEELLFRSLLLGGLEPLVPTATLLIGSGLLFGLMHSPQGIWGMFGASLAGIFLGILFLWYESVLTPIVAHYVANLLQIGQAMRLGIVNNE